MLGQRLMGSYFCSTSESVRTASNDRLMSFRQSLDNRQTIALQRVEKFRKGKKSRYHILTPYFMPSNHGIGENKVWGISP